MAEAKTKGFRRQGTRAMTVTMAKDKTGSVVGNETHWHGTRGDEDYLNTRGKGCPGADNR